MKKTFKLFFFFCTVLIVPGLCQAFGEIPDIGNSEDVMVIQAAASADMARDFVSRFYTEVLGRTAETAGLDYWTDSLKKGTKAGADVAMGFILSQEFINQKLDNASYLNVLYFAFFNRQPDQAGYSDWLGKLNSGEGRDKILNGFIYSQEFLRLCQDYGILAELPIGDTLVQHFKNETSTYNYSASKRECSACSVSINSGTLTYYIYPGYTSENINYKLIKSISVIDSNGKSASSIDYYYYDAPGNLIHYMRDNNKFVNKSSPSDGAIALPSQFTPGYSWTNNSSMTFEDNDYPGTETSIIIKKETIGVPYGMVEAYKINYSGSFRRVQFMTSPGKEPREVGSDSLTVNSTAWVHPKLGFIKEVANIVRTDNPFGGRSVSYYSVTSELVSTTIK